MAKLCQALPLLAIALCLFNLFGSSYAENYLFVEGKVYCDTCRAAFETKLSTYIQGAKVRLECHKTENGEITYTIEGVTDATGTYKLPVQGEHEEETCNVILMKSPLPDCSEILKGGDRARIHLTSNNGMVEAVRHANPLGFLKKESVAGCTDALRDIGLPKEAMIPV